MIPVNVDNTSDETCAVHRTCSGSGCGCRAVGTGPDAVAADGAGSKPARRGLGTALLAAACAAACLAVPIVVGGAAAVSGAVAGEWWVVAAVVTVAAVAVGVLSRRRGGRIC